jgi:hypothetical protein
MAKLLARRRASKRSWRAAPSKSNARDCHNRGWAVDLAPMYPLFWDIGLLDPRAGRVPENEIITLNDQGANSRRVA